MSIEQEIFNNSFVCFDKLLQYGFIKNNNKYKYCKVFFNNDFKAEITINNNGIITGRVIDIFTNEEYINIRVKDCGDFTNKVKEEYKKILIDIKKNCFESNYFKFEQSNRITKYIKYKYKNEPEFLWDKYPLFGIFRCNNKKWYSIIMNIDYSKISNKTGEIEIINVKLDEDKINKLLNENGFYKAYHMSKKDWITIVLDDTLKDEVIMSLIDESYNIVNTKNTWIIPANPKYYDIINCYNDTDEIIFKQSSKINVGDIVFIYVASPYSKIMYKCLATEVNIPYKFSDKNLSINYVMRIKLLKRIDDDYYTFDFLKKLGIKTIRGPIKINKKIYNYFI